MKIKWNEVLKRGLRYVCPRRKFATLCPRARARNAGGPMLVRSSFRR